MTKPRESTPSFGESSGTDPQFLNAAVIIRAVTDKFTEYYSDEESELRGASYEPTGQDRRTYLLAKLMEAQEALRKGEIKNYQRINLFRGITTRNREYSPYYENSQIVENWYRTFNESIGRAGGTFADYYGLENYTRQLNKSSQWVMESAPLRFRLWDDLALRAQSGRVAGLQQKIGPNLFVEYKIPNIGFPEKIVPQESKVNLYVVPSFENNG